MVVYWDLTFAFNVLLDYLLLFAASRLAGRGISRGRLLCGALVGGLYALVQLFLPRSMIVSALALVLLGAAAFYGSGRAIKLTLLFFLCACAFGGVILLLGQSFGNITRLARGILSSDLPWGVFLLAFGSVYVLLGIVFRCGAAHTGKETARATIVYRGKSVQVRLLRDTGNTLTDPLTGLGVPVIDRHVLRELIGEEEIASLPRIAYCSVGCAEGTLPLLYCEAILLDGKMLGPRAVALSERPLGDGGAYAGLWCEGCEKGETNAQTVLA